MSRLLTVLIVFGLALPSSSAQAQPDWWKGAVFYEIFVRSFQDSGSDGVGDLKGITSRLDYIEKLGIDGLWLTPIFPSPSYHGYDATDFRAINPDYGSLDDFKAFIAEAHKRHIKVILDLAVNHTSEQCPWFKSRDDWYLWSDHDVKPWIGMGKWHEMTSTRYYYSSFSKNMPDLNWHNADVRAEVKSILRYWSQLGVDGFRLDAARYYVKGPKGESDTPETHRFIEDFAQDLRHDFPDTMFVGEIWADAPIIASYLNSGRQLDLAFNFPVAFGLKNALIKETAAPFVAALKKVVSKVHRQDSLAPFLTNHDMIRIATEVKGNAAKLKLAGQILMTLPGTPFVYYGEELGLANGPGGDDREKRTPMPWATDSTFGFSLVQPWQSFSSLDPERSVATQLANPDSILATYRKAIAARHATEALKHGTLTLLTSPDPRVAIYRRSTNSESTTVFINFSSQPVTTLQATLAPYSVSTR